MGRSGAWAVLPVKTLQHAKQRLAGVLGADERAGAGARHGGGRAERARREPGSGRHPAGDRAIRRRGDSPHATAHACCWRRRTAATPPPAASALATLAQEGAAGMLQVPADIPLVTPEDIAALLAVHGEAPAITLAPSRDARGTNAVACSPPDLMPLRFGADSFVPPSAARAGARHRAADRRAPRARARYRHARRPRGVPRRALADPRLRLSDRERHRQAHQPPATAQSAAAVAGAQARQHLLGIEVEEAPLVGAGGVEHQVGEAEVDGLGERARRARRDRSTRSSGWPPARSAGRRRASPSRPGPRRRSSPRARARARPSGAYPAGRAPGRSRTTPSSRSCARCCPGRGRPSPGLRRAPAAGSRCTAPAPCRWCR